MIKITVTVTPKAGVLDRIQQQTEELAGRTAEAARDHAADLHENAPRGGNTRNKYGRARSAPGEPPAPEDHDLLRAIRAQTRATMRQQQGEYDVFINHDALERGRRNRKLRPRPMRHRIVQRLRRGP